MTALPVTLDRIERALDEVALAIDTAGAEGIVYLPIYERLEREATAYRSRLGSLASARARLERRAAH